MGTMLDRVVSLWAHNLSGHIAGIRDTQSGRFTWAIYTIVSARNGHHLNIPKVPDDLHVD